VALTDEEIHRRCWIRVIGACIHIILALVTASLIGAEIHECLTSSRGSIKRATGYLIVIVCFERGYSNFRRTFWIPMDDTEEPK